ncbi:MAG: quinone-dependent dihydroorotate dehydrogenase [Neisseriaceae bacterium]
MNSTLLSRCLRFGDAERAHQRALGLLEIGYRLNWIKARSSDQCPRELMGLKLLNPIGLAAGLDKNGEHIDALAALGFGFIEVGTVTPRAQPGNPKPRLFRVEEEKAVINRMGFNNLGLDYLIGNLKKTRYQGILGINLGKNADTPLDRAVEDYRIGMQKVYLYASYLVINISSPNTKNLRVLQTDIYVETLLETLKKEQLLLAQKHGKYVPLVVKIAPDLTLTELKYFARIAIKIPIDGIICSNTTIDKTSLKNQTLAVETGGLSGAPLLEKSNQVLTNLLRELDNGIPVIAVGGVTSAEEALLKFQLGASAVQLYTGLVYRGPGLVRECVKVCCAPN